MQDNDTFDWVKEEINDEIDGLIKELIRSRLLKHTIQIFSITESGLMPFGTGVLVLIQKTHFLLTASHVAAYIEDIHSQLFVKLAQSKYIPLLGEFKYTDLDKSKGIDLAYIKLDSQLIPDLTTRYLFLTIDKILAQNRVLNGVNYCIIGFPEKNIEFDNGILKTGASSFMARASNDKPYSYYNIDKKDHIIISLEGKATDIFTGNKTKVNSNFYGMSGCGLWFIIYELDPITNMYSIDYKLVGVTTEFRKGKFFCLIAVKIRLIMEAFEVVEGFEFRKINK